MAISTSVTKTTADMDQTYRTLGSITTGLNQRDIVIVCTQMCKLPNSA